jgi:hypothetical protein
MKQLFVFLILLVFLNSCSESFNQIDPGKFNAEIAGRTDIKTPEELIREYYGFPESEGSKTTVESENLRNDTYEITLIREGLGDDSQFAEKIVMTAKLQDQIWNVIEIKMNWKCMSDRGHTSWGTGTCN